MKKFLCLLLFSVMLLQFTFAGVNAALKGDINADGASNNKDVVSLFKYVSGDGGTVTKVTADFNRDSKINNGIYGKRSERGIKRNVYNSDGFCNNV